MQRPPRFFSAHRYASSFLFALSLLVPIVLGASLMAFHVPYQAPAQGVAQLVGDLDPGRNWRALHILSSTCACSHRVAEHLINRKPFALSQERVLLAGKDEQLSQRLRSAGYEVDAVSGDWLAQHYGLAGAPWLIIVSPAGEIAYQGGYAKDARASGGFADQMIWSEVTQGRSAAPLPVFGCALGRTLQRRMDPFGLKYQRN